MEEEKNLNPSSFVPAVLPGQDINNRMKMYTGNSQETLKQLKENRIVKARKAIHWLDEYNRVNLAPNIDVIKRRELMLKDLLDNADPDMLRAVEFNFWMHEACSPSDESKIFEIEVVLGLLRGNAMKQLQEKLITGEPFTKHEENLLLRYIEAIARLNEIKYGRKNVNLNASVSYKDMLDMFRSSAEKLKEKGINPNEIEKILPGLQEKEVKDIYPNKNETDRTKK